MNKSIELENKLRSGIFYGGILTAFVIVSFFGIQSAHAMITNQLDLGSTGSDVTELQTYLSTDSSLYPSKLVTGYFGPLTQSGVGKFQTVQGIVSNGTPATTGFGRVGPQTMLKLNQVMGNQSYNNYPIYSDIAPILTSPLVQFTRNSATVTWNTNEPTQGQFYYDTNYLRTDEATGPNQQPYVSGIFVLDTSGLQTTHTLTINNLQPDTLYYYLVRGVNSTGNMSTTLPYSFRTSK